MFLLPTSQVKYKGTITGLRVSAVDGTAFIDGATSSVTDLADGNHSIEIYDSAGRMLRGVLKAAGTSEGLGSEEIVAWANAPSGYEYETLTPNANGHDLDAIINSSATGRADFGSKTVSALYKGVFNVTYTTGNGIQFGVGQGAGSFSPSVAMTTLAAGVNTVYVTNGTGIVNVLGIYNSVNVNGAMTASCKQVTAPSSAGATIVSAKAGETYNFSYKNASFTYNAASYYCIIRAIR
jgi:hypothetical protein